MQSSPRPKIMHLINSLGRGGAETVLCRLVDGDTRARFEHVVVSMIGGGALAETLTGRGIEVHSLGMGSVLSVPAAFWRLRRLIRSTSPDLIQAWMYHANLAATLYSAVTPASPLVLWNIRHSIYDLKSEKFLTRLVIRLAGALSSRAVAIVFNSYVSAEQHKNLGYSDTHAVVIPNGFDCDKYRPDETLAKRVREELGVDPDQVLIGLVARYHPMKDHENFIAAAERVADRHPTLRFLLAGRGADRANATLLQQLSARGLQDRFLLLGERSDMEAINNALDIACNASYSEGFPNNVGEAMACGAVCVATDVGDSVRMIGTSGYLVPPADSGALADALCAAVELGPSGRAQLTHSARDRIETLYPIKTMVDAYADLYSSVIGHPE